MEGTISATMLLLAGVAALTAIPRLSADICTPPCSQNQLICDFDHGGNGYKPGSCFQGNCSDVCQYACQTGVVGKLSKDGKCWWGYINDWGCFAGEPPCSDKGDVIGSAYLPCKDIDCTVNENECCSKKASCKDLIEDKSECVCN